MRALSLESSRSVLAKAIVRGGADVVRSGRSLCHRGGRETIAHATMEAIVRRGSRTPQAGRGWRRAVPVAVLTGEANARELVRVSERRVSAVEFAWILFQANSSRRCALRNVPVGSSSRRRLMKASASGYRA